MLGVSLRDVANCIDFGIETKRTCVERDLPVVLIKNIINLVYFHILVVVTLFYNVPCQIIVSLCHENCSSFVRASVLVKYLECWNSSLFSVQKGYYGLKVISIKIKVAAEDKETGRLKSEDRDMGDRGATGGAWGARDDASWWSGGSGEIQHQQQINEEIARSTAAATHQLYTYKMTSGFSNNGGDNSAPNFDYRLITNSSSREDSPQQPWWYASGSVENQQTSSPSSQNHPSPDSEQSNQPTNAVQQNHQTLQQQQQQQAQKEQQNQIQQQQNQLQQQLEQHQNLQQAIQQAQNLQQTLHQNQQQTLQQMLQQQQLQQLQQQQQQQTQSQQSQQQQNKLEQSNNQPNLIQVTQAQAQALVAQAALQQQVVQTLQQQQQSLQEHLQAVQQQQIQAALQRQSATLQELQQQQALISQNTPKARMPRAKPYNKPRGRMTAYAFFVQTCREEHKKKYPDENVVFAAFSKKCAERWNTMSEKEKLRFHEMAEQDKKRYDLEMKNYVPPKDVKVRGRKRQQPKDPNAPKRSLSAFFWFCNDERSKVKANNPEYTMGDIAKELGRRWAAADPETKTKYEGLSEKDKARYDREMTAYKKSALMMQQHQHIMEVGEEDTPDFDAEDEYK